MTKLNGKAHLTIAATIAGFMSAIVSSCATVKLMEEKRAEKVAEYQELKDRVTTAQKALDDHMKAVAPIILEHQDAMRMIPVLGDRSLRTLSDIQEIKGSLEKLNSKIDRMIEREKGRAP